MDKQENFIDKLAPYDERMADVTDEDVVVAIGQDVTHLARGNSPLSKVMTAPAYLPEEIALIERMADALGCTLTELTRRAVLAYVQPAAQPTFTMPSATVSYTLVPKNAV